MNHERVCALRLDIQDPIPPWGKGFEPRLERYRAWTKEVEHGSESIPSEIETPYMGNRLEPRPARYRAPRVM